MGERARLNYLRRTTPEERFEHGLELSDAAIRGFLARHGFGDDLSPDEARRAFRLLRARGG